MMTMPMIDADGDRPRVLIVDPDPDLSMATLRVCIALGLEPKLCAGPGLPPTCPGLARGACPRTADVRVTLVAVHDDRSRLALPVCAGEAKLILCSDSLEARGIPADARLSYPYDPHEAAALLRDLAFATDRSAAAGHRVSV